MNLTLSAVKIPASNQTVLLVAIFMNPSMFGGGGSTDKTMIMPKSSVGKDLKAKYFL
jgi:hypothetical protein